MKRRTRSTSSSSTSWGTGCAGPARSGPRRATWRSEPRRGLSFATLGSRPWPPSRGSTRPRPDPEAELRGRSAGGSKVHAPSRRDCPGKAALRVPGRRGEDTLRAPSVAQAHGPCHPHTPDPTATREALPGIRQGPDPLYRFSLKRETSALLKPVDVREKTGWRKINMGSSPFHLISLLRQIGESLF